MTAHDGRGVLLVEADPVERGRLTRELEACGWGVWPAADAAAADRVFASDRAAIRAAVVDLDLPGLEGGRLLARIESLDPDLPRVALAEAVSERAMAAFRRLARTPLVPKPAGGAVVAGLLDTLTRRPVGRPHPDREDER